MPVDHLPELVLVAIAGGVLVFWALVGQPILTLYLQARLHGAPVHLLDLIAMRLRGVDLRAVVFTRTRAIENGIELSTSELEVHALAGGRITNVVTALIAAKKGGLDLNFSTACALEPRIIDVPAQGQSVRAQSADGVPIRTAARLRVRTSIQRVVGGAPEDELVRRVAEAFKDAIAQADVEAILADTTAISDQVRESGLADGTAFDILDIKVVVRRA